ncbi:MAG: protein-tyrosine phosphatase family protein [Aridibacter sp.]
MQTEIYWTNEKLATMPRPRGFEMLEYEIKSLKESGVDVIVSTLVDQEISKLGLENEKFYCRQNLITYLNFPITDHGLPDSFEDVYKFVRKLSAYYEVNKKIAVHCFAGIGRSSLIACCLLVLKGMDVDEAFTKISNARGFPVPDTQEQIEWAYTFAEKFKK